MDAKAVSAYSSDRDNNNSSSKSKPSTNSSTTQTPRKMLRLFALYENLCRFVLPLCSLVPDRSHSETPISQSSNVVDLSGVGLTKFWALRNHMSDASQLATAHYPETLDRIFVVGAPSFFPTVWEYAKRWFDPITVVSFSEFLFFVFFWWVQGWGCMPFDGPFDGSVCWIGLTCTDGEILGTGEAIFQLASLETSSWRRMGREKRRHQGASVRKELAGYLRKGFNHV